MSKGKHAMRRAGLVPSGAVALALSGGTIFAGAMFGGVAVAATGGVLPTPSATPCPSPIASVCSTLHKTDKDVKKTVHHLLNPGSGSSGSSSPSPSPTKTRHHHPTAGTPGASTHHHGAAGAHHHGTGTAAGRASGHHKGALQGVSGLAAGSVSYAALPTLPQGFAYRVATPDGQAPMVAAAPDSGAASTVGAPLHSSAAALGLFGGHRDPGLPIAAVAVAIATVAGVALAHAGVLQQRLGRGSAAA